MTDCGIQPQPGKADRTCDLYKISGELGALCEVLLALHAFTGCDTTSAPFRNGKKKQYHHLCETAEASGGACTYSARLRGCTRKPGKRYSCTCIRCSVIQVTQPRQILQTEADHGPKQDPVTSNLRVATVTNLALPPPTSGAARMHSFKIISASAAMVRARHGPAEMGMGVASRQPSAHWLRVSGSTYASPKNDLL